jgi:hypothetical protein
MSFQTVNPATGEPVRTFEWISDRDLERWVRENRASAYATGAVDNLSGAV